MTQHNKREVCFIVGKGGAILWADASDSPVALPDSRSRWDAIWNSRDDIEVIAHSHPVGPAAFSAEDVSTMEALDSALGKVMRYMVVAPRTTIAREGTGPTYEVTPEPWWAALLRLASGMTGERPKRDTNNSKRDGTTPSTNDSQRDGNPPSSGKDE